MPTKRYIIVRNEQNGDTLVIERNEWSLLRNAIEALVETQCPDAGYVFIHPFKVTAHEG